MHWFSARWMTLLLAGVGLSMLLIWSGGRPPTAFAATATASIVEPSDDPDSWTYDPLTLTVNVGDKVTWTNKGQDVHTVTSDDGSFDSGDMKSGASWSYTFTTPGTYTYYCGPHTWMAATVIVNG